MAYATNAQVASEFKNITFSATSSITLDEVDRFIEEADAYIDSKLSQKYVTPITGTTSLILVRQISVWLAAQRVKDIMRVKSGATEKDQGVGKTKIRRLDDMAKEMLSDILNDKLELPDASLKDTSEGVYSYVYHNNIDHKFDMENDQW